MLRTICWSIGRPWRTFLMNKADIVKQLSEQVHVNQKLAKLVVDTIVDTIKTAIISGERVEIRGFGSFSLRSYKPYKGRNPKNGEIIEVPAKRLPYFRVGKELKETIWENH
jgi:integration host factor subunit beta